MLSDSAAARPSTINNNCDIIIYSPPVITYGVTEYNSNNKNHHYYYIHVLIGICIVAQGHVFAMEISSGEEFYIACDNTGTPLAVFSNNGLLLKQVCVSVFLWDKGRRRLSVFCASVQIL